MAQVPLPGEQSALMGFRWQYDHIARLTYEAIVDSELVGITLASVSAGQVDDLLIHYRGRRAAYQYKSGVSKATLTFSELLRPGRTPAGGRSDSLWRSLARAWATLEKSEPGDLTIHLAMTAVASTSDHLVMDGPRPTPDHFRAFLARAIEPLRDDEVDIGSLPEWAAPLKQMEVESGLSSARFRRFLRSVRLDLGHGDALEHTSDTAREDIVSLSTALIRLVSRSSGTVELSRDQILSEMRWQDRKTFKSAHDFPVDRTRYSPLSGAITSLQTSIARLATGYVAVTGPPGSGKSTLLTQTLSGVPDRVVRYYAFIPGGGASGRSRLSAEWFLHDLSTMLRNAGVPSRQKQLTPETVNDLRRVLAGQLESASSEFVETGRKTIVVVDGLDHVQRDYSGNDALTAELPRPSEIPQGVLFVVGTRDLTPLPSEARQFIDDARSETNLERHRLSRSAILNICRSDPEISLLPKDVHALLTERSAGHPLALAYLLNQLGEVASEDAVDFLRDVPAYNGDIAGQYRAVWDQLSPDAGVVRLLRLCSRLRVGFELDWTRTWASESAVHQLLTTLRYLFRVERKRWFFFHDSFRQFAREMTSIGEDREPDDDMDARAHSELAELCERSASEPIRWQAIFHRSKALQNQDVLRLGTQAEFRRQFLGLRSAAQVADDARLVLRAAAETGDFPALLRGLLILSEVQDKADELDGIDVCKALFLAGRTDDAIDFVGDEQSLRVPLARAYNLAADLARESNPAGYRIFESFHHLGLDEPGIGRGVNATVDVARAWGRCAAHFLPMDITLSRLRDAVPLAEGGREWEFDAGYRLFAELVESLVSEPAAISPENLLRIDALIVDELKALEAKGVGPDRVERLSSVLGDLRYTVRAVYVESDATFAVRSRRFAELYDSLKGTAVYESTLLDIAEQEAQYLSSEQALQTLQRTEYDSALTLSDLSTSREHEDAIATRLRYWTLRHAVEIGLGTFTVRVPLEPIESVGPNADTPAGNDITPRAIVHEHTDAISIASRIDRLVRTLGLVSAIVQTGTPIDSEHIWSALGGTVNLFPPFEPRSPEWSTIQSLRAKREELHTLTIRVLASAGARLLARYQSVLNRRFESQPSEWPASLQIRLGLALRAQGAVAPWLSRAMQQFESEAPSQGVNGALHDLFQLISAFSILGDEAQARRVVSDIPRYAFGLGSRNDQQLSQWIEWFGRALGALDEKDVRDTAFWLAQVCAAADPLTDQDLGSERLPAVIAGVSPALGLEIFEYMVGNGAISHPDGLSELLAALVATGTLSPESVNLAAELTAEIVAATGNRSNPHLARELRDRASASVLQTFRSKIQTNALTTTRSTWLDALSYEPPVLGTGDRGDDEDYNALELDDGTKLTRRQVVSTASDLSTLADLVGRAKRASTFKWEKVLEANFSIELTEELTELFAGTEHFGKVLLWLADSHLQSGDPDSAASLAQRALPHLPLDSWTSNRDGGRRHAIHILVCTDRLSSKEAARDFSAFIAEERWYSYMLGTDLDAILAAMEHGAAPSEFWSEIREYLNGYVDRLELPPSRPVPTVEWWAQDNSRPARHSVSLDADGVIGELAVIHVTHPAWPVREGIARIIVAALRRHSMHVESALARLAASEVTDDVLESIASYFAAADDPDLVGWSKDMTASLREHPNVIVRRLAHRDAELAAIKGIRSLPGSYRLVLPDQADFGSDEFFGEGQPFLAPFEARYEMLADVSGLELSAILAVAARYASEALQRMPSQALVNESLVGSNMKLAHPSNVVFASRSAFGRVLGDLLDAGLVGSLSTLGKRMLRTGDRRLVGMRRAPRPAVMPAPPKAGHDQTTERWLSETEDRINEYAATVHEGNYALVGAKSSSAVLNWSHVEEEFRAFLVREGSQHDAEELFSALVNDLEWNGRTGPIDELGDLLVENDAMVFMERRSDWVAVHPVLARSLGWTPRPSSIGGWLLGGRLAAETTDWNDGTWGRSGPMFEDSVSEGFAVVMSAEALATVKELVGPMELVLRLRRFDRERTQPSRIAHRRLRV